MRIRSIAAAVLLSCPGGAASAQTDGAMCSAAMRAVDLTRISADLARLAALRDTVNHHPFLISRSGALVPVDFCNTPAALRPLTQVVASRPGQALSLLPAEMLVVGNSAYPQTGLDGALWGGKGLNVAASLGATARWRWLSAAVAPVVAWQSNAEFDRRTTPHPERSEFAHPVISEIDVPTRFGDGSFAVLDPGGSFLRLDVGPVGAGISSEHIVWGASLRNPLLLSSSAPGFPHVFIELARPVDIWIGRFTAQTFWGRLDESDYFDSDPENDERLLAGLALTFQPAPLEGLSLGAGRLYSVTLWPEVDLWDAAIGAYRGVKDNVQGRTGENQLLGLFFRWVTPRGGLEVFGEWVRDDHWGDNMGLLRGLDASQAWSLGFQKLISRSSAAWRIHAETVHLGDAQPSRTMWRGPMPFYAHSVVTQGHTNRGQILGAPVGTGGEAQYLRIDRIGGAGMTGISVERARYDNESYLITYADTYGSSARDTELSLRLSHMMRAGPAVLNGEIGWSRRHNRNFLGLDTGEFRREDNVSGRVAVRLSPGGVR